MFLGVFGCLGVFLAVLEVNVFWCFFCCFRGVFGYFYVFLGVFGCFMVFYGVF